MSLEVIKNNLVLEGKANTWLVVWSLIWESIGELLVHI